MSKVDAEILGKAVLRQLANAMVNATSRGIDDFILSMPVGTLHAQMSRDPDAEQDPSYLDAVAHAIVQAAHEFGGGMRVIIPSDGGGLNDLIRKHASQLRLI